MKRKRDAMPEVIEEVATGVRQWLDSERDCLDGVLQSRTAIENHDAYRRAILDIAGEVQRRSRKGRQR